MRTVSKEPRGPAIANEQPERFDVVRWVTYAIIKEEELDINSQNINGFSQSKKTQIKRFGSRKSLGQQIGLSHNFAKKVITKVDNYEEFYEGNIVQPFNLERGT